MADAAAAEPDCFPHETSRAEFVRLTRCARRVGLVVVPDRPGVWVVRPTRMTRLRRRQLRFQATIDMRDPDKKRVTYTEPGASWGWSQHARCPASGLGDVLCYWVECDVERWRRDGYGSR